MNIFVRLAAPSGHPVRTVRQLPHQLRAHVQNGPERTQFRAPEHGPGMWDYGRAAVSLRLRYQGTVGIDFELLS